jgi:hypothetical protein
MQFANYENPSALSQFATPNSLFDEPFVMPH